MGCCCCCCKKKQKEVKVKKIDYEALKAKHAKASINFIIQENMEDLKNVISEGFTPDLPFDIGGQDSTLVILSIVYKKYDVTMFLLDFEQNLDVQVGKNKDSALVSAVSAGNVEIVEKLIQKGAYKHLKGKNDLIPRELAEKTLQQKQARGDIESANNYKKIVKLLN